MSQDYSININTNEYNVELGQDQDFTIEINQTPDVVINLNEQGPIGPQGEPGVQGLTGNGIETILQTGTEGLVDTYTIYYTSGDTQDYTVTNGEKGDEGEAATIEIGTVTTGAAGTSATVVNSGTSSAAVLDFTIPRGDKGDTGATGADGYSPTATVTKSGTTATISITDKNGTTTATISDGTDGVGVAAGGTTGQVLAKKSNTDYDTEWTTVNSATWGNITGTLSSQTDLQNALNAKYDASNPSGYISGITSSDVTTALGYTPYNSSNPNGYTSNVGTVTSVNNTSPDSNGNVSLTIPTVNNATLTITQGGTTKGTFTANASSDVTIALDAGGSNVDIDGVTITKNSDDELQTIAVIDQNNTSNALKLWTGITTQVPSTTDATTLYFKTDDADVTTSLLGLLYPVGSLYIASGSLATCPLQSLGVGTWQLKANSTLVTSLTATSTVPVQGNGMTLGLTDGTYNIGFSTAGTSPNPILARSSLYGQNYGVTGSGNQDVQSLGVTTDATKSGLVADTSSLLTTTTLAVTIWERVS